MPSPLVAVRFRRLRKKWEVDCRRVRNWRARRPLFETEEAAQTYATEVRRHVGRGAPRVEDREVTLRAYAERWLARLEAEGADPKAVRGHRYRLDHLLPTLGTVKIRAIRGRRSGRSSPRNSTPGTRRTPPA